MGVRNVRLLLLSSLALLPLYWLGGDARSQTTTGQGTALPEVTVTAPSPIVGGRLLARLVQLRPHRAGGTR